MAGSGDWAPLTGSPSVGLIPILNLLLTLFFQGQRQAQVQWQRPARDTGAQPRRLPSEGAKRPNRGTPTGNAVVRYRIR